MFGVEPAIIRRRYAGREVIRAVYIKVANFWDVMPRSQLPEVFHLYSAASSSFVSLQETEDRLIRYPSVGLQKQMT